MDQQPLAGEMDQQPLAGEIDQQPLAGEMDQQPLAGEMDQQPSAGGSSKKTESAGLEKLAKISHVMIKQAVVMLEDISTFETKNQYKISDIQGNELFTAKEEGVDCCTRNCCGAERPFVMEFKDKDDKKEVLHLRRPMKCHMCCFPCCLQYLEVSIPDGTIVGTVQQEWAIFYSKFNICDKEGNLVMKIIGPCCTSCRCGDVIFKLISPDGKVDGHISNVWSGLAKVAFTDADNFGISFPVNMDVHAKATLIGAAMLIDFMFFEGNVWSFGCFDCLVCAAIFECIGAVCSVAGEFSETICACTSEMAVGLPCDC